MSCYRPLPASRRRGSVAPPTVGWRRQDGDALELPCGRCIGCRLDRGRMWQLRILHEAQLYDSNYCATFTYDQAHVPFELEYRHFQLFLKRLRKAKVGVTVLADRGRPIRFFVAGEYGGMTGRPHWHAILFNVQFADRVLLHNGKFRSAELERLWSHGGVELDAVSPQAAAYVAGYTVTKAQRAEGVARFELVNLCTGELSYRRREFAKMSLNPALGTDWFVRFAGDLFPGDFAVSDAKRWKVPRFYWERFKRTADPGVVEEIAYGRYLRSLEQPPEESAPERRAVREEYAERRAKMFSERGL